MCVFVCISLLTELGQLQGAREEAVLASTKALLKHVGLLVGCISFCADFMNAQARESGGI